MRAEPDPVPAEAGGKFPIGFGGPGGVRQQHGWRAAPGLGKATRSHSCPQVL